MASDIIAEIAARVAKATAGPWSDELGYLDRNQLAANIVINQEVRKGVFLSLNSYLDNMENDKDFIAHAREDIPFLLDKIKHLQEENIRVINLLSESGFCTHYPGHVCNEDWPKVCPGCIKDWLR